MNFALPSAFFWLLLAAPIILFYILKVRLRRVETSTSMFWNQIYDEKPPRSIWEVLRHLFSLLAQLLLLLLLILALADPYLPWQLMSARRLVVVIDPSASMQAEDVTPSRFESAIEQAKTVANGLRFRDEMAIVLAGEHPRVALGMSGHIPTIKRTLSGLHATDAPTDLTPAVELGKRLIADHPHGEVIVLTDGCDANALALSEQEKVTLRIVGKESSNVGITQFQARRSLVDPLGYELMAAVHNASNEPVECRLEIELEGDTVDVLPLKLAPGETWNRTLEKTSQPGGVLQARLRRFQRGKAQTASQSNEPATNDNEAAAASAAKTTSAPATGATNEGPSFVDHLTSDNEACAILAPRTIQRVLLVTPGNLFLQKVFEANPLVDLLVIDRAPPEWPEGVITVLHKIVPETLPPGQVWVIDPQSSSPLWEIGNEIANPIVTQQDPESPLMTHLKLDNVLLPKARAVTFQQPANVLAGAIAGEPLYADLNHANGHLLMLAVNLEEGDLTFRTAFPIMVTNALNWFAGGSGEMEASLATGSVARLPLPEDGNPTARFVARSPDGRDVPLTVSNTDAAATSDQPTPENSATAETASPPDPFQGTPASRRPQLSFGPLNQIGIWTVELEAEDSESTASDNSPNAANPESTEAGNATSIKRLAANLASPQEMDLRPPKELLESTELSLRTAAWGGRPLWIYLLAAVLVLATVEWVLTQRRVIR